MYFITTKRMLEVCFFQHTPTFIIEPEKNSKKIEKTVDFSAQICYYNTRLERQGKTY